LFRFEYLHIDIRTRKKMSAEPGLLFIKIQKYHTKTIRNVTLISNPLIMIDEIKKKRV